MPLSVSKERRETILGAIDEIRRRPDLSPEAKARGIRALKKALARVEAQEVRAAR